MSTKALQTLLDYLQQTLTYDNRKWLAEHLLYNEEENLPKMTMEEINQRIDQSEREIAEGKTIDNEEMMAYMKEYVSKLRQKV